MLNDATGQLRYTTATTVPPDQARAIEKYLVAEYMATTQRPSSDDEEESFV